MARIAPLHLNIHVRGGPKRASLRHIGVPDGRDILALYFRWVRQRYYRARVDGLVAADAVSVTSVIGDYEERGPVSPVARTGFEMVGAGGLELFGVGGQFD